MTDAALREKCEALLLSDSIGCSYVHHMALDALIHFAQSIQAVAWVEAAKEFEENWDGGDPKYGCPTYLAWLKAKAKALEGV